MASRAIFCSTIALSFAFLTAGVAGHLDENDACDEENAEHRHDCKLGADPQILDDPHHINSPGDGRRLCGNGMPSVRNNPRRLEKNTLQVRVNLKGEAVILPGEN